MTFVRNSFRTVLCMCVLATTASTVRADDPPLAGKKPGQKGEAGDKNQDQAEGEGRRPRAPRGEGEGRGGRRRDPGMFIERMSEELSLSKDQETKIRAIMTERFNQARQAEGAGVDMDKARDLREQMRDAREAGDTDKAREIGEKLREVMSANRDAMEKGREEMHKQIDTVLNPEQREKFAKIREEMAERGGMGFGGRGGRGGAGADPQALKRTVLSLKLGDEQQAKIEAIFKSAMKENSELPRGDRQARMDLMRDLQDDVMNQLTKEQKDELREKLADRRGRGEGRRERRPGNRDRGNAAADDGRDL